MIYGSVCSGIESASVAWAPLGWKASFFAEIEPFPCAVLAHHYPEVPNLGDFTKIEEKDVEQPIDLLVGGTPCQSFSVAGRRLGLDDPRGNLALEFLALARRLRPRWLVFENVPGLLSLDEGWAFGTFLRLVGECGYGWAYRILDAQYVRVDGYARAVPQRRRRVFVVGHLGDWRPAAAVLLEPEGMRGDPPPRREAGQGTTAGTVSRALSRVGGDDPGANKGAPLIAYGGNNTREPVDVATACRAKGGTGHGDFESETFVTQDVADPVCHNEQRTYTHEGENNFRLRNVVPVLEAGARTGKSTDDPRAGIGIGEPGYPMFSLQSGKQHAIAFDPTQLTHPENRSVPKDLSPQLTESGHAPAVAFSCKDHGADAAEGSAPTLRAMGHDKTWENGGGQVAVAFQPRIARNGRGGEEEVAPALNGADAGATSDDMRPCVRAAAAVRRLTPRECERLQGLPDDYTAIPMSRQVRKAVNAEMAAYYRRTCQDLSEDDLKRLAADGPRYKALGNAMAINCMRWIGARISLYERIVLKRNAA
jgi:DNA (cytosine-5)-methyltransferase 1